MQQPGSAKPLNRAMRKHNTKLGVLYFTGDGVPQDFAESYFWRDIAAPGMLGNANQKWVTNYRDAAAAKLTASVLLQIQERARKWFEDHPARAR